MADGFSTMFVGIFSDRGHDFWLCNKFGRRKSWHLFGFICVLFSFPFIFSTCIECSHTHQYAKLVYFGSFMIIFQFGWASTQISHLATIPDLGKNQTDRTTLTAFRYIMTNLSTILVYLIGDYFV